MNKTGLILEGGAMRGLFTAGVLDVFMENNIRFDGCIGVSAGAAFGCSYHSGQKGRTLRYNKRFAKDPRYCSWRSWIKTGDLYGVDFCYRELPEELDRFDNDAFVKNPAAFYVVCTDVETGKAVYVRPENALGEDLKWFCASASMPMVSRPVEIGGRHYLDGGIADSVPLHYFQSIGYNKNVVILTRPRGYRKSKNKLLPLMRMALKKYPAVYEAMARRHKEYNKTMELMEALEEKGEILVIRPPEKLPVGHIEHDPHKMQTTYDIGRAEAQKYIKKIKEFIKKEG